ncbi:MAG: glucuronosyltransferase [Phycisphaerales bacterium]|nr:glucuronosyltransferase [Phycisphaerales bacterium]
MIFVTVGTQLAFDRMVRPIDEWAGRTGRADVFAQIGPSEWIPRHIEWKAFVDPGEFAARAREAAAIVAHAGMGSIITALTYGKPIVIMPRRAALGEQRNDHQLATAARFEGRTGVFVAHDETELPAILDGLADLQAGEPIPPFAAPTLIKAIREFIDSP